MIERGTTYSDSVKVRARRERRGESIQRLLDFRRRYPPQRLDIDGQPWVFWDMGKSQRTLVFLHGLAGSGDVWFQQLLHFSHSYRVIAPTYPAIQPLDRLAEGVWELLGRLGVGRFQVIGSSLGGLLAQHMLTHRPERLERVVIGNTFPPGHPEIMGNSWKLNFVRLMPGRSIFSLMKRVMPGDAAERDPGMRLVRFYLQEQYKHRMTRGQFLSRAACVFSDFDLAVPAIPHAIIESLDDNALSRAVRADLKRLYPRAWLYTFKRGGHFPYLSRPEEYNRALAAFLDASYV